MISKDKIVKYFTPCVLVRLRYNLISHHKSNSSLIFSD